jgi:hypothetical protein
MSKKTAPFAVINFVGTLPMTKSDAYELADYAMQEWSPTIGSKVPKATARIYEEATDMGINAGEVLGDKLVLELVGLLNRVDRPIRNGRELKDFADDFDASERSPNLNPTCNMLPPELIRAVREFFMRPDVFALIKTAVENTRVEVDAEQAAAELEKAALLLKKAGYVVTRAVGTNGKKAK